MRPVAAIGAILVMIGLLVRGVSAADKKQVDEFGDKPERITLKALIERGAHGPKSVVITDFVPCDNYLIMSRVKQNGLETEETLERCFVPLVPLGAHGGYVDRSPLRVQIVIHRPLLDGADPDAIGRHTGPELRGLVEGTLSSLDLSTRRALSKHYPDTEFEKCLLVTEGTAGATVAPPGVTRKIGTWMCGLGCVLLGVAAVLAIDRRAVTHRS